MKVLLVTSQLIEDKSTCYKCSSNFYDIIKRFCYLGELYICAGMYNGKNSHLKIDKDLDGLVKYGNVSFIKKNVLLMCASNKSVIERVIDDVDLVISYGASYDVFILARKHKKKFMSFVVSCAWDAYWNHGWKGKILAPYKYQRARYTIKHSDYVLYVSNDFLQKRYPTNAKYQCGCSNVKIPTMSDETLTNRLNFIDNWDGNEIRIATTAAVDVIYKGQQYVIRALYQLKKKGYSNIHYYLLGGGDNSFLKSIVKRYELEEQVHFMGIVPHEKVLEILDKMHVYIQPSLQEGLPRAMVEAMSRGLLCIGAKTAAIPELVLPQYVIKRRSYSEIAKVLERIKKEELLQQAKVNFDEAKNYQDELLNERRNAFFDKVINDIHEL